MVQPLAGLGLAVIVLIATLLRDVPVRRLAPVLVVLTALAAIGGPNLAAPPAPWLFLFRILIVAARHRGGGLPADGRAADAAGRPPPARGHPGVLVPLDRAVDRRGRRTSSAALRWTSFMGMMGGLAIAIALICRSPRRARILLWSLMGAFAVAVLVAMAEVATGLHLPSFRAGNENAGGLIGVGSLFGNQNNFATFLSLSLPYFAVLPIVFRDMRLKAGRLRRGGRGADLHPAGRQQVGPALGRAGRDRAADARRAPTASARGRLLVAGAIAALAVALVVPIVLGRRAGRSSTSAP